MSVQWLAKVKTPHATIFLMPDWRWVPAKGQGEEARAACALAQAVSEDYTYSPADGRPGGELARAIAEHFGGAVTLPPGPPEEDGVLY